MNASLAKKKENISFAVDIIYKYMHIVNYSMSKKSGPITYSTFLYKIGKNFFDIQ